MKYLKYSKLDGKSLGIKKQPDHYDAPVDTPHIGYLEITSDDQAKNAVVDLVSLDISYVEPEIDHLALLRSKRNRLLAQTDWTQLPDAPVNKTAWATYRQALRDLPATVDTDNPVWPEQPE